jgi:purine-binding chemotaxis protein CheW
MIATDLSIEEGSAISLVSTFYIADALCGVDTASVQEVIAVGGVTKVHHAPDYIKGVINLRGKIVTIIDLSRKLELPQSDVTTDSRIFIVEWQDEFCGRLVDAVADVVAVDLDTLRPSPANIGAVQGKYFQGVCHPDKDLVAILDLDAVLSDNGV